MTEELRELELLHRAFDRMFHDCLRQAYDREGLAELTNPQLLFILRDACGERTFSQKDLADYAGVSPPTIAISLKRMEKAGLVQRVSDEADQRRNIITLTEKGKRLTGQCYAAGKELILKIMQDFSGEEVACLCNFYKRMIANMEQLGTRAPTWIS